ncbi:hypothetical protein [Ruegeria sp. R14_0]|uniref:hypothetical protein n=1 Tax=Ruegeria sp. R14_0 TaxID=2821100 RepID=UPI001ADC62C7|nr:hypothetical protein [Ruegeria sp. R14_0]MBO9447371.1 hypothetical protein [Ruegeria sp. R14_0]
MQTIMGEERDHMSEPLVTADIRFFGSQFFSIVPLVDLYLKLMPSIDVLILMMLAGISTPPGNVFIISAASSAILLQMADRMGAQEVTSIRLSQRFLPLQTDGTHIASRPMPKARKRSM